MSRSIDQRIVEMRFDNKSFQQNVKETIRSLDELDRAAKVDHIGGYLESMSNSLETVASKFTTMGITGVRILENLADQAYRTGLALVKSLTTDQIGMGKSKYEQKMTAVQTIMMATGKSVEEVEKVMSRLNRYTDETSYKFDEMSGYISNFTTAGVDLETAERAMEGIANAAARAGINANNAGRAMHVFSKAMSKGKMQLTDWQTLDLMSFSGPQFNEKMIEAGLKIGTLKKDNKGNIYTNVKGHKKILVNTGNIANTLNSGWMTKNVMLEGLNSFYYDFENDALENATDDLTTFARESYYAAQKALNLTDALNAIKDASSSGWMQTWQLLFGDLDQASELFTDLANRIIETVNAIDEYRNAVLGIWSEGKKRNEYVEEGSNVPSKVKRWQELHSPNDPEYKSGYLNGKTSYNTAQYERDLEKYKDKWYYYNEYTKSWREFDGFQALGWLVDEEGNVYKELAEEGDTGREMIIDGLFQLYESISQMEDPIKKAWNKVFLYPGKYYENNGIMSPFSHLRVFDLSEETTTEAYADKLVEISEKFSEAMENFEWWLHGGEAAERWKNPGQEFFNYGEVDFNTPLDAIESLSKAIFGVGREALDLLNSTVMPFVGSFIGELFKPDGPVIDGLTRLGETIYYLAELFHNSKIAEGFSLISSAIGEFLAKVIGNRFANLVDIFQTLSVPLGKAFDKIGDVLYRVGEKLPGILDVIASFINNLFEFIGNLPFVKKALAKIKELWGQIKGFFSKTWNTLSDWVTKKWKKFKSYMGEDGKFDYSRMFSDFKKAVKRLWKNIKKGLKDFFSNFGTNVKNLWEQFTKRLTSNKIYIKLKAAAVKLWERFKKQVSDIWSNISDYFTGIFNTARTNFRKKWDSFWSDVGKNGFFNTVKNRLSSVFTNIKNFFSEKYDEIVKFLFPEERNRDEEPWYIRIIRDVAGKIVQVKEYIQSKASGAIKSIKDFFQGVLDWVNNLFAPGKDEEDSVSSSPKLSEDSSKAGPWYVRAIRWVAKAISDTWEFIKNTVQKAYDGITGFFDDVVEWASNLFGARDNNKSSIDSGDSSKDSTDGTNSGPWYIRAINWVVNALSNAWEFVKNTAQTAYDGIVGFFNDVIEWVSDLFGVRDSSKGSIDSGNSSKNDTDSSNSGPWYIRVIRWVANALTNAWDFIKTTAQSAYESIAKFFGNVIEWVSNLFTDKEGNKGNIDSGTSSKDGTDSSNSGPWYIRAIRWVAKAISDAWEFIKGTAQKAYDGITRFFDDVVEWVSNLLRNKEDDKGDLDSKDGRDSSNAGPWYIRAIRWVAKALSSVWEFIKNTAQSAYDHITEFFQGVISWVSGLFSGSDNKDRSDAASDTGDVGGSGAPWYVNLIMAAAEWIENAWNTIKETAAYIWENITEFFDGVSEYVQGLFEEDDEEVDEDEEPWYTKVLKKVGQWLSDAWTTIESTAQKVWDAIKGFFRDVFNYISEKFSKNKPEDSDVVDENTEPWYIRLIKKVGQWLSDAWSTITSTAQKVWDAIKGFFRDVFNYISEKFSKDKPSDVGEVADEGTEPWYVSAIKAAVQWISDTYNTYIKPVADTVFTAIGEFFTQVYELITSLIHPSTVEALSGAQEATEEVAGMVSELVEEGVSAIADDTVTDSTEEEGKKKASIIEKVFGFFGQIGTTLADILSKFSNLSFEQALQLIESLTTLITRLAILVIGGNVSSMLAGWESFGRQVSRIGLGIALMTGAVYFLSKISETDFENGLKKMQTLLTTIFHYFVGGEAVGVGGGLVRLGIGFLAKKLGVTLNTSVYENIENIARSMLAIGAGMALIQFAIHQFGKLNITDFAKSAAGLLLAGLFEFLLNFAETKIGSGKNSMLSVSASLLAIGLGMIALVEAIKLFRDLEITEDWKGVAWMAGLYTLFEGLSTLFDFINTKLGSSGAATLGKASTFVGIGLGMLALAAAVRILGDMDSEDLNEGGQWAVNLGLLLTAMMAVFQNVGLGKAIQAGLAIDALAAAVGGAIYIVELLVGAAVENASETTWYAGSMLEGASEMLENVKFMRFRTMITYLKDFALLSTDASVTNFCKDKVEDLLTVIQHAGITLKWFNTRTSGIEKNNTALDNVRFSLSATAQWFKQEGVAEDVDYVVRKLAEVAGALQLYNIASQGLAGSGLSELPSKEELTEVFKGLIGALPSEEEMAGINAIAGDSSTVDSFYSLALALGALGTGVAAYAKAVSGATSEDLNNARDTLDFLKVFGNDVTYTTFNNISSATSLANFGQKMEYLAGGVTAYIDSVKDVQWSKLSIAKKTLSFLAELEKGLAKTDGVWAWITGTQDLSKFGGKLKPLGDGIRQYYNEIKDIDKTDLIDSTATFLGKLADVWKLLSMSQTWTGQDANNINTFIEYDTKLDPLKTLGEDLKGLGGGLQEYNTGASKFDSSKTDTIMAFIERVAGMNQGLTPNAYNLTNLIYDLVGALQALDQNQGQIEAYLGSINWSGIDLAPLNEWLDTIVKKIRNRYGDTNRAGVYLMEGLEAGIYAAISKVTTAAYQAGLAGVDALNLGLGNASPSYKGHLAGAYLAEGTANGITDNLSLVQGAAENLGEESVSAMQDAMFALQTSLSEEIDTNPVIRPVMDLSDIESRSAYMNSLFNSTRYNLTPGNTSAIANLINSEEEPSYARETSSSGMTLDDVIDEIAMLNDTMGSLQVVLNNGVLVGQLAPGINRALGRAQSRTERGG